MDKASPSTRIEVLEPLRGVAALAVAWYHFTRGGNLVPDGSWIYQSGAYGWMGVEVFFVISGFIIPYSMHRGGYRLAADAGRFVLKRVIRLDPPYVVAIALTLGLTYASLWVPGFQGRPPEVSLPQLLAHFGYLNAFLGYTWLSPVFWTLAIEFQFYLVAALTFPLLAHRRPGVRLATLAVLAASAFVAAGPRFVFHYAGLFALGGATFHRYSGMLSQRAYLAIAVLLAVATGAALSPGVAVVGLATALVIATVRMPRVPALAWLGSVSYSVYLLHVPIGGRIVNLGSRLSGGVAVQLAVLGVALAASLVASWVLYRWVERPAQRWSSSIRYKRPVPPPAAAPVPA